MRMTSSDQTEPPCKKYVLVGMEQVSLQVLLIYSNNPVRYYLNSGFVSIKQTKNYYSASSCIPYEINTNDNLEKLFEKIRLVLRHFISQVTSC
jgi:hypothetical protein